MAKPTSIKITCPACDKETEMVILKHLNKDEYKEELEWYSKNKEDMIAPDMTKSFYDVFRESLKDSETIEYVIGKIKSHKLGLIKNCINSDKTYKVLFYYFMDHEKQLGGMTFRIGEKVGHTIEMLNMAEVLANYCTTLNKQSMLIVLEMIVQKDCTFTGDVAMLMQLNPDLRHKFQCVAADSSMNPKELREFISILRDRLEDNGEKVVAKVSDAMCIIECFKNEQWYECVAVASKGHSINQ